MVIYTSKHIMKGLLSHMNILSIRMLWLFFPNLKDAMKEGCIIFPVALTILMIARENNLFCTCFKIGLKYVSLDQMWSCWEKKRCNQL